MTYNPIPGPIGKLFPHPVKAGCERIFEDKTSGVRDDRPGLREALSHLREKDCLVIWRLDRLGRRMIALLGFVEELRQRGCDVRQN